MPKAKKVAAPAVAISTEDLVALSFAAYRVHNNSVQQNLAYDPVTDTVVAVEGNRQLITNSVGGRYSKEDGQKLTVTEEDRNMAREAISSIPAYLMLQPLVNAKVNDFWASIGGILSNEMASEKDIGIATYVPKVAEEVALEEKRDLDITDLSYTSKYVGVVGEFLETNFVLHSSRFITTLNCWSIVGHDGNGNAIKFLTGREVFLKENSRIRGKVKDHSVDKYLKNASVTSLKYVKII